MHIKRKKIQHLIPHYKTSIINAWNWVIEKRILASNDFPCDILDTCSKTNGVISLPTMPFFLKKRCYQSHNNEFLQVFFFFEFKKLISFGIFGSSIAFRDSPFQKLKIRLRLDCLDMWSLKEIPYVQIIGVKLTSSCTRKNNSNFCSAHKSCK